MSLRRLVVEVDTATVDVRAFCADHGISTWFFYDLRRRVAAEGMAALEPRSRAPHRVANRIDVDTRVRIVELRKELDEAGLDSGPESIWVRLPDRLAPGAAVPSPSTIWRELRAGGFITPAPQKAPRHAYRSFTAERANECWQVDAMKLALADGTVVEVLNVVDDCTRLAVASLAVAVCTTAATWDVLCAGAERWGWPARVLTDNAPAFKGDVYAGGGGIEPALRELGIGIGHSRPFHPQTCGKVERFHQTLRKFLAAHPIPATLAEVQALVDRFVAIYNDDRPHRSLGRRTPAAVWAETPKSGPASEPLGTPTVIFRSRVNQGQVQLGRRRRVMIGAAHDGELATAVVTGLRAHVFVAGRQVRKLELSRGRNNPLRQRTPIA